MRITIRSGNVSQIGAAIHVYAAFEGEERFERLLPDEAQRDEALKQLAADAGFRGAPNETVLLPHGKRWTLIVGLGKVKELTIERARQFAGTAVKTARARGFRRVGLPGLSGEQLGSVAEVAQALAEGALLGLYRYDKLKEVPKHERNKRIDEAVLLVERAGDVAAAKRAVEKAEVIAEAVALARDLITGPSNLVTPTHLADTARAIARQGRLNSSCWIIIPGAPA